MKMRIRGRQREVEAVTGTDKVITNACQDNLRTRLWQRRNQGTAPAVVRSRRRHLAVPSALLGLAVGSSMAMAAL